jgi:hypothetical protein
MATQAAGVDGADGLHIAWQACVVVHSGKIAVDVVAGRRQKANMIGTDGKVVQK